VYMDTERLEELEALLNGPNRVNRFDEMMRLCIFFFSLGCYYYYYYFIFIWLLAQASPLRILRNIVRNFFF
jgi:hypothetical protein